MGRRPDSTVLAYVLKTLNERYNYGLDLVLLSIDEGITGYRDDSLEVQFPWILIIPMVLTQSRRRSSATKCSTAFRS
jgi:hypothetical protein